jgi:hypothetical protein
MRGWVTIMLRLTSLVMTLLLAVPVVRDCCLPVTRSLSCHGSTQTDKVICSSDHGAIAEDRAAVGIKFFVLSCDLRVVQHVKLALPTMDQRGSIEPTLFLMPLGDLYLRTHALLI